MSGIVDVRMCEKTGRWHAKPRFVFDRESMEHGAPSGEGSDPTTALYDLCRKMPLELANKIQMYCHRMYRSPEYVWMNDKCMELDGHFPTREEWAKRRMDFEIDVKLGHAEKYGLVD